MTRDPFPGPDALEGERAVERGMREAFPPHQFMSPEAERHTQFVVAPYVKAPERVRRVSRLGRRWWLQGRWPTLR